VSRSGIYCGWIGFHNLGDDTTFQLCRKRFPTIDWSPFNEMAYTAKPAEFIRKRGFDLGQMRRVVSEELADPRRLRSLAVKTKLRLKRMGGTEVGICGGDMYINRNAWSLRAYTEVRKRTGAPVPVFGTGVAHPDFWIGRDPDWVDRRKEWVRLFEELPVVGVRGPNSKAHLEEAGARNVVVCGDPASLLHANYAKKPARVRRDGPLRVGINAGPYPRTWGSAEEIQSAVVQLARWLREAGHKVELIPTWNRDTAHCIEVGRQAGVESSAVRPVCASYDEFLQHIENLDLMVAWNLHAGILAAAANVPFVSIEYQPKCRDFAASIGWEEFLVKVEPMRPAELIGRVEALMQQLDSKRTELCQAMCRLMKTFTDYCNTIDPLLLK
jgi:hypothetical protein